MAQLPSGGYYNALTFDISTEGFGHADADELQNARGLTIRLWDLCLASRNRAIPLRETAR
jgi:hypothetical protein